MSVKRRKAAFDPAAIGDLDELLPSLNLVREAAPLVDEVKPAEELQQPSAPRPAPQPIPEESPQDARNDTGRIKTPEHRRRSSARGSGSTVASRTAPPEVALSPAVYAALRALTLRERAQDRTTARSYGQVALDAVELHAAELQEHWKAPVSPTTGLFKRRDESATPRRRHSEPQARVPLAGVIPSDAEALDRLAEEWGAGSRSALIEQALRLYLGL